MCKIYINSIITDEKFMYFAMIKQNMKFDEKDSLYFYSKLTSDEHV